MKKYSYITFLVTLILVVGISNSIAQQSILLDGKEFFRYDNRMIDYNRKAVFEIDLNAIVSLDSKPEEGSETSGNLGGGRYNYGFGIDISRFMCTQQSHSDFFKSVNNFGYGVYYGIGYEFVPNQCHKAKVFVGHKSGLWWGYVNFINKIELMFEDDLQSDYYRLYMRFHLIQVRIDKLAFNIGLQGTMQEAYEFWPVRNRDNFQDFDDALLYLQVNYSFRPRKW